MGVKNRVMGINLAILAIGAGLQWGCSLVVTGLVASFPSLAMQLDGTIQLLLFLGSVASFLMFVPIYRVRCSFYESSAGILVAALGSIAGWALLISPVFLGAAPVLQYAIGAAFLTAATGFGLFNLITCFAALDVVTRLATAAVSLLVACIFLILSGILPVQLYHHLFFALMALKWGAFLLYQRRVGSREPPSCGEGRVSLPSWLYIFYGVCIGALPGLDALGRAHGDAGDAALLGILSGMGLVAVFLILPSRFKGMRYVEVCVAFFYVLGVLYFGVSLQGSVHAVFIFVYLFYWAYLVFGVGAPKTHFADPLVLVIGGFAGGWVLTRLFASVLAPSLSDLLSVLSIVLSAVALSVPVYVIAREAMADVATRQKPTKSPDALSDRCQVLSETHGLTRRENEVFVLVATGYNRQYICEKLVIAEGTARTHIKNIYRKLGVHSKEELIDLVHQKAG